MAQLSAFSIYTEAWFAALLDASIKAAVILGAAMFAMLAMRRATAALRHLVWALAIASVICLPTLALLMPAWTGIDMSLVTPLGPVNDTPIASEPPEPIAEVPIAEAGPTADVVKPPSEVVRLPGLWSAPPDTAETAEPVMSAQAVAEEPTRPLRAAAGPLTSVPVQSLLLVIWALGALAALTPALVGTLCLRRIVRQAGGAADPSWEELLRDACSELRLRRPVTLFFRQRSTMPMVWGWLRPVLLLPAGADTWPHIRKRLVLLHELAHLRRADYVWQWLGSVACSLYWFNPLIWCAAHRMRREGERACDDLVLNAGCDPAEYAGALVEITRRLERPAFTSGVGVAMARRSTLEARIGAIMEVGRQRRRVTPAVALLAALAAVTFTVAAAGTRVVAEPSSSGDTVHSGPPHELSPETSAHSAQSGDVQELYAGVRRRAVPLIAFGATGGPIHPIGKQSDVIMDALLVDIDLYHDHADVDATFTLRNSGEATTVHMGVPESGHSNVDVPELFWFTSFAAWVDGEDTAASIEGEESRSYDRASDSAGMGPVWSYVPERETWTQRWRWRTLRVPFAAGQSRSVRVRYSSKLGHMSLSGRPFHYRLGTSARWDGSIESGRVRLQLHYGPHGGWFELAQPQVEQTSRLELHHGPQGDWFQPADPHFKRIDATTFKWTRHSFEPTDADELDIRYHRRGHGIYVGPGHIHRGGAPEPYIDGGRLWAQVRDVADWMEAELVAEGSEVRLIRGGTTVTLRAGSQWMYESGRKTRLPHPARMQEGHLMVPVAAVAKPFDAVLEYHAGNGSVRIMLPLQYDFLGATCQVSDPWEGGYVSGPAAVAALPPGWAPLDREEYSRKVRERYIHEHQTFSPWLCRGDFNGDGLWDLAVDLRRLTRVGTAVLHGRADGSFSFHWVCEPTEVGQPPRHTRTEFLLTRSRDTIDYREEGGVEPAAPRHDSIERADLDGPIVLYYWDDERGAYSVFRRAG